MPDNPLKRSSGNKVRAASFLSYFKDRGFKVDFVSEHTWGEWNEQDVREFENSGLAENIYVLHRKPLKRNLPAYLIGYRLPEFFYQLKRRFIASRFPDLVTHRLQRDFNRLLKKNSYDYILINYASWGPLAISNPLTKNAAKVLDTHDFLTAQYQNKFPIGPSFREEIKRLSAFDLVLAISVEEQYLFSQFCKTDVRLAPMTMERPPANPASAQDRKFDLIYVASDNIHNLTAAKWFFDQVCPLLPKTISICIIGAISAYVPADILNVTKVALAKDLTPWYQQSKIALCPMFSGTGTKIKVVEALAFGLPVVCNTRGIDGLLNKTNNGCLVTDQPQQFKQYILDLLSDPSLYDYQSSLARMTFESGYEKDICYKKLDELFL